MNAQLCTSTVVTTVFLASSGISPTLVILLAFLILCFCLSKKNNKHTRACDPGFCRYDRCLEVPFHADLVYHHHTMRISL